MPVTAYPEVTLDGLPSEVQRFRDEIRAFARDEVAPRAQELDNAPANDFAWDVARKGHDLGLTRAIIPRDCGGLGMGVLPVAIALEELAAACPGVALIFGATMLGQAPILLSADPRLEARYLPLFSGDEPVLACSAVTEDEAGSDLRIPQNAHHAYNVTTARRDGDFYVLSGRKSFIVNAPLATFATVFANLEGYPGASGLTCFIVPLDAPGVVRGPVADMMGYRSCLGGELLFKDVRVPAENVVGGECQGLAIETAQGNMARSAVAAISTGVASRALEHALTWCGYRVQGGAPLYKHQFTAAKLASMAADVDAARLLYRHAATKVDNELPAPSYEPAIAKLFADRIAIEVSSAAVSLMGARGYVRSFGLEKILRDSYGARIYEGTPEILALAITESMYRDRYRDGFEDL
jgi:alkylation response protein AidB-like acyl-CoA dehydrogenase